MVLGRKQFGEKHERSVILALFLFIAAFAITMVAALVMGAQLMVGNWDFLTTYIYIVVAGGVLGVLSNVLLVYHLQDDNGKKLVLVALVVGIAVQGATAYMMAPVMQDMADAFEELEDEDGEVKAEEITDEMGRMEEDLAPMALYGLPGSILFLIAFILPYLRIDRGELKPEQPQYPAHDPSATYPCPKCGNSMQYHTEEKKWYCRLCRKYF